MLFALFRLLAFSVARANQNYDESVGFVLKDIRQNLDSVYRFSQSLIAGRSHAVLDLVQGVLKHRAKFSSEHVMFGVEVGVR
jgi:hypothetical protein